MAANAMLPPQQQAPRTSNFLRAVGPTTSKLPASQSYVVLCKVVLKKRLKNMFLLTGIASWIAILVAVFDPKELPGSLLNCFSLSLLLYTPLALAGALPVFILRKQSLTTAMPVETSRLARWMSVFRPAALPVLLSHAVGAVPLLSSYIWCASAVSRDPRVGPLFYDKGRDALQVNERWIYLLLLHVSLALYSTCEHLVRNRSRVSFESDFSSLIPKRLGLYATERVSRVVRSLLGVNALFYVSYLVLRKPILRFLVINFAGAWTRPYLYTLLRHNAAYSFSLPLRAIASSAVTLIVWEVAHLCFDVYATHPMRVSHFAPNPNQCLLTGLRSEDAYFQHFAYLELAMLTLTDEARRKAIFVDIKPDGLKGGGAWHEISREALKLLGTELQRAKGKGKIPVKPTHTPLTTPSTPSQFVSSRPTLASVKSDDIFKPVKKSFFDKLAAGGISSSPSKPPTASSSSVALSTTTATSRVPAVFQTSSATPAVASAVVPAPVKLVVPRTFEESLGAWVPQAWRGLVYEEVFGPTLEHQVGMCVKRRRETIWAIQALSNLLCASLREDPYGVAQRDIPKTLEGFVLYLLVLESLSKDLVSNSIKGFTGLEQARRQEAVEKELVEQVVPVEEALKDGIRAVLAEFSPFLSEFKFPPRVASKLQLIVDWS